MDIIFSCPDKTIREEYPVKPASTHLPKWYKELGLDFGDGNRVFKNGSTSATVRRCVPFLDAISAGYIISLPSDVFVSKETFTAKDGETYNLPYYSWPGGPGIGFHSPDQAKGHPLNKSNNPIPKFLNPWAIETPKGYSCLFVAPMNDEEYPFKIMSGIVDTDTYHNQINFPFILVEKDFEGMIKAGTPIAQVIPFKRDSWKMKFGNDKNLHNALSVSAKIHLKIFDAYRKMFWAKKEFK